VTAERQRSAIVTGAASGIGSATAARLMRDGWRVVGIDLRNDMPRGVEPIVGDAARAEVIQAALNAAQDRLDGLVCAAGLPPNAQWDDETAWHELLRVDLTGPFEAARLCMPALAAVRGSVVLVGSIVGPIEGSPRSVGYAAAKAGLVGVAKSLALVAATDGVRVNVVEPGAIDTPLDPPRFPADDRPDVPLGRMGTADEVASVISFLLSDDASYVTGAEVVVDGGRSVAGPNPAARRNASRA
jgi:NAD(P)-dependent dehydrogenase (short-subunit alcohol dehydrogenase family)